MPTVVRNVKGYRFFFFSLDRSEPIHIHVSKGNGYAKFWLDPIELARSRNFRSHELEGKKRLVEENVEETERRWHEHFGR